MSSKLPKICSHENFKLQTSVLQTWIFKDHIPMLEILLKRPLKNNKTLNLLKQLISNSDETIDSYLHGSFNLLELDIEDLKYPAHRENVENVKKYLLQEESLNKYVHRELQHTQFLATHINKLINTIAQLSDENHIECQEIIALYGNNAEEEINKVIVRIIKVINYLIENEYIIYEKYNTRGKGLQEKGKDKYIYNTPLIAITDTVYDINYFNHIEKETMSLYKEVLYKIIERNVNHYYKNKEYDYMRNLCNNILNQVHYEDITEESKDIYMEIIKHVNFYKGVGVKTMQKEIKYIMDNLDMKKEKFLMNM